MTDIRILSGTSKATKLSSLDGQHTRPTRGRVVENIFNILAHNPYVENFSFRNQTILDVFAGSGRLGLEGLSRGAHYACFIDNAAEARKIIHQNIHKCRFTQESAVLAQNATSLTMNPQNKLFSLVFCDAPYQKNMSELVIHSLINKGWLANNALLCIETEKIYDLPQIPYMIKLDQRDYGLTRVYFLKYTQ